MENRDYAKLIKAAVAGDTAAAGRLLLMSRSILLAYIEQNLPRLLRRVIEPNDVLQDTHIEALRRIRRFVDQGEDGFHAWLVTIARYQMIQLLRARKALKRGAGLTRGNSATDLLEGLLFHERTPSRSAARYELAIAIEVGLQRIRPDYAVAVRMRHIEQLAVGDVAMKMSRSERAVEALCRRGLVQLRDELKSMTLFQ